MVDGGQGYELPLEEEEFETAVTEQAQIIERAIVRGFEALDVDGRIERALDRRESAGASQRGGPGGSNVGGDT